MELSITGRVNIKPGKPITFATCSYKDKKKYLLCLPGNPVSATVTTYLFVLPLLNLMYSNNSKLPIVQAEVRLLIKFNSNSIVINLFEKYSQLSADYKLDSRPEFARALIEWNDEILPKAHILGNQISSRLMSFKNFNALLILPPSTKEVPILLKGCKVKAMFIK